MTAAAETARRHPDGQQADAFVAEELGELARRGLTPARVEGEDGLPVIRVAVGTPPITPEMVRRALDED